MAQSEFVGQHGPSNNIYWASSIPTAGTYKQGDICFNTAPAANGVGIWQCVVAGTPGTWKILATNAA